MLTPFEIVKYLEGIPSFPYSEWAWQEYDEWRLDSGGCDCSCSVCSEVKRGKAVYLFRYISSGREVRKLRLLNWNRFLEFPYNVRELFLGPGEV